MQRKLVNTATTVSQSSSTFAVHKSWRVPFRAPEMLFSWCVTAGRESYLTVCRRQLWLNGASEEGVLLIGAPFKSHECFFPLQLQETELSNTALSAHYITSCHRAIERRFDSLSSQWKYCQETCGLVCFWFVFPFVQAAFPISVAQTMAAEDYNPVSVSSFLQAAFGSKLSGLWNLLPW